MPRNSSLVVAAAALLVLFPATAPADSMGENGLTPSLEFLEINHVRITFGALYSRNVRSLLDRRLGDSYGPYLSLEYGVSKNAVITVEGMPYKVFDGKDGRSSDAVGDFTVWTKFLLQDFGPRGGYGVRFGTKLPNTPSNLDFGTNHTDFFLHLFGGRDVGAWKLSAYGGIGILDRPRGLESQDDVVMVGVLGIHPLGPKDRIRLEAEGFARSFLYGNNWGLHVTWIHRLGERLAVLAAGQLSTGRLYGNGELRLALGWNYF